jgi:NADH-quinone oxidoreductase subunit N
LPEVLLTAFALLMVMLDLLLRRKETLAFLTVVGASVVLYAVLRSSGEAFGGMVVADGYALFFKLVFLLSLILSVLISVRYLSIERAHYGEYYGLMLFATVGMMFMASAQDLIVLYLGLELMALSTYVLAGFLRHSVRSGEAAMKYFLLGAFASAFLLLGMALTYGLSGSTDIRAIASSIAEQGLAGNSLLSLAVLLYAVAFGFKIAAVPFHMWAPDVYEGAPTPVTAFMSVGPKAAGFAALGRVFLVAFPALGLQWGWLLAALAVLSMVVGNVLAIAQDNIKRMLAYSSIAHAGYALLGVIAGGQEGIASTMNYLLIYGFMNIGAFTVVLLLRAGQQMGEDISEYQGLAKTRPLLAALMLVFMFSLTGIPPTAGFMGKLYVFMAALKAGYTWLVVVAVLMSVVSAYFYLRVVMYMYMRPAELLHQVASSAGTGLTLALSAAFVLLAGVLPSGLISLARWAAAGFGL